MKESKLLKFDKKVLVAAVNIARRKQLVGEGGRTWEQFLAVRCTSCVGMLFAHNAAVRTLMQTYN